MLSRSLFTAALKCDRGVFHQDQRQVVHEDHGELAAGNTGEGSESGLASINAS